MTLRVNLTTQEVPHNYCPHSLLLCTVFSQDGTNWGWVRADVVWLGFSVPQRTICHHRQNPHSPSWLWDPVYRTGQEHQHKVSPNKNCVAKNNTNIYIYIYFTVLLYCIYCIHIKTYATWKRFAFLIDFMYSRESWNFCVVSTWWYALAHLVSAWRCVW